MNKHDFLQELLRRLSRLPQAEREKAYAFYAEIIDDSMEDGMSENEAVVKLGSMDEIVERIAADVPLVSLIKLRASCRPRAAGTVILLVFGFPVWFPALISAASVLFTLFVVFWIIALMLWVALASIAAAAVGSLIGIFFNPDFGTRLLLLGGLLAGAGCAALLYPASAAVTKQFAYLTKRLWMAGKNALIKKGDTRYETV